MGCACNPGEQSSTNEIKLSSGNSPKNKDYLKVEKFKNVNNTMNSNLNDIDVKNENYMNSKKEENYSDLDYEEANNITNFSKNENTLDNKSIKSSRSLKSSYSDTYNCLDHHKNHKNKNNSDITRENNDETTIELDNTSQFKSSLYNKINQFRKNSLIFNELLERIKTMIVKENNIYYLAVNDTLLKLNRGPEKFSLKSKISENKKELIYDEVFELNISSENTEKIIKSLKENKLCMLTIEKIFKDHYLKLMDLGYSLNGFYYDISIISSDLSLILQVIDDNIYENQRYLILSSEENTRIGITPIFFNYENNTDLEKTHVISFISYGFNYYED